MQVYKACSQQTLLHCGWQMRGPPFPFGQAVPGEVDVSGGPGMTAANLGVFLALACKAMSMHPAQSQHH